MEGYLKIIGTSGSVTIFRPESPGLIQLEKISDSLTILRLYFNDLKMVEESEEDYFDRSTAMMLTNFKVEYGDLNDLDRQTITIAKGWRKKILLTMLSVYDGQPINDSQINFERVAEGCFNVKWTGSYGQHNEQDGNIEFYGTAYHTNDVTTPLCDYNHELIEYYNNAK